MNTSLKVSLFKENNGIKDMWVVKCVDYNLVAQGETEESAKDSFRKLIISHVFLSDKYGHEPFEYIKIDEPDLSTCEQCNEKSWDGYICHSCGMKII